MQVDVSPGQDQPGTNSGFCAADARAGGALTRVELQLPWRGAGKGHRAGCGRSGVLPAVWWQGVKEPPQSSCYAGPGAASEGVKCLLFVWGSYLSSVHVLTYSRAEPVDNHQWKTAQSPQVLTLHFGCQSPPSQPTFSEENSERFSSSFTVSIHSVLSVCGYLVEWTKLSNCVGQKGDVATLFLALLHAYCFSFILIF